MFWGPPGHFIIIIIMFIWPAGNIPDRTLTLTLNPNANPNRYSNPNPNQKEVKEVEHTQSNTTKVQKSLKTISSSAPNVVSIV